MSEVSGLHCTIFSLGPDDFELEDASRNGTYWNDARLLKASVRRLGRTDLPQFATVFLRITSVLCSWVICLVQLG